MSVFRRVRRWLALALRPGEPEPDRGDLNLPPDRQQQADGNQDQFSIGREEQLRELHRRNRRHHYRAGPWQQK